eukprot:2764768-Pyramimonas_sp.AAC.1
MVKCDASWSRPGGSRHAAAGLVVHMLRKAEVLSVAAQTILRRRKRRRPGNSRYSQHLLSSQVQRRFTQPRWHSRGMISSRRSHCLFFEA